MTAVQNVLTHWNWTSWAWLTLDALIIFDMAICGLLSQRNYRFYLAAVVCFMAAFVSPVGVLADGYLFSAHIVQHLLLLLIAPLFYILSLPESLRLPYPLAACSSLLQRYPQMGWILGMGAMWVWHVPSLCHAAGQTASIGAVRDATLLMAGGAFWWPVLAPSRKNRLQPLESAAYLFSACVGCTLLGVYVTFTPVSVCPIFSRPIDRLNIVQYLRQLGFTPATDQQLGGLLMWVPPCLLYGGVIINLIRTWYAPGDQTDSTQLSPQGSANG